MATQRGEKVPVVAEYATVTGASFLTCTDSVVKRQRLNRSAAALLKVFIVSEAGREFGVYYYRKAEAMSICARRKRGGEKVRGQRDGKAIPVNVFGPMATVGVFLLPAG